MSMEGNLRTIFESVKCSTSSLVQGNFQLNQIKKIALVGRYTVKVIKLCSRNVKLHLATLKVHDVVTHIQRSKRIVYENILLSIFMRFFRKIFFEKFIAEKSFWTWTTSLSLSLSLSFSFLFIYYSLAISYAECLWRGRLGISFKISFQYNNTNTKHIN